MKREDFLLLLSFLLMINGYLFENVFPALLAFSVVLYLVFLRLEFSPNIVANRVFFGKFVEGEKITSKLKISNLTNRTFKVKVREILPPRFRAEEPTFILNKEERKEIEYKIIPVRGTYKIKGPELEIRDLRELYFTTYVVNSEINVEVYPSVDSIKEDIKEEESFKLAMTYQKTLFGLQSLEIHSLRKFQSGDDFKRIDWKATARLGELIVREFFRETEGEIYIILDASKEMRKSVRKSKIDYATTLTLQLAYALKKYRVGLIVYDDFGVKHKIDASKSPEQIEKIVRALKVSPIYSDLFGVKFPEIKFELSKASRKFLKRVLPVIKKKPSFSSGVIEAIGALPSSAFLIFISDITSHTSELFKVLLTLKDKYRILLLTPNPILFYDESKLDRETLLWLYRRYTEREEILKKFSKLVPTLDLGPSDLIDIIRRKIE